MNKNRGVFIILGLLFGMLGFHNFYAGYYVRGLIQLLITVLTGWLIIPLLVLAPCVVLELFLVKKDANGFELA